MAFERVLHTRLQLLCDTSSNWALNDTKVLLRGEIGIELLDNGKARMKLGTGGHAWKDLPYHGEEVDLSGIEAEINKLQENVIVLQNLIGVDGEEPTGIFAKLNEKANLADVYTKDEINGLISNVYRFCGSVENYNDLPKEGNVIGDVWNVKNPDVSHNVAAGDNFAWTADGWDNLGGNFDLSGYATKEELENIKANVSTTYLSKEAFDKISNKVDYEIFSTPVGTQIRRFDKEIRIMCPKDTIWKAQSGAGNPNLYYIGFRAYAPSDKVVSFKEDQNITILDETMNEFTGDYAGIDIFGRKYSILWLPVAVFNGTTWTYYGASSSVDKYIGWHYSVEWYDANGQMVNSDCIKLNLSNEQCHSTIEPYYTSDVVRRAVDTAKAYIDDCLKVIEF